MRPKIQIFARGIVGHDRPHVPAGQIVISGVGVKLVGRRGGAAHHRQHFDIVSLAVRERKDEGAALAVAQFMDPSCSTTAGATNRLTLLPVFGLGRQRQQVSVSGKV